jgi:hypothetical protein
MQQHSIQHIYREWMAALLVMVLAAAAAIRPENDAKT